MARFTQEGDKGTRFDGSNTGPEPLEVLSSDPTRTPEEKERTSVVEWLGWLAAAVVIAVIVRIFVAEVYIVPTGSMLETIQLGDRLLGEKISYRFSDPEVGDIVTFEDPNTPGSTLIKRVIAVGGQTVDLIDGIVYVDGVPLDEPYTLGKPSDPLDQYASFLDGPITYPYVIPEGYVWVMGDNRTNSLDSRYFGPVSVSSITSRGVFIFWPPEDASTL